MKQTSVLDKYGIVVYTSPVPHVLSEDLRLALGSSAMRTFEQRFGQKEEYGVTDVEGFLMHM